MKQQISLLFSILFWITINTTTAQIQQMEQLQEMPQQVVPNIALPDINQQIMPLAALNGRFVYLDFWSPVMNSSIKYTNLHELRNKYLNAPFVNANGFEVYSVAIDGSLSDWQTATRNYNIVWPNVADQPGQQSAAAALGVSSIPTSFLIAPDGVILGVNYSFAELDHFLTIQLGQVQQATFSFKVILGVFEANQLLLHDFNPVKQFGMIEKQPYNNQGAMLVTVGPFQSEGKAQHVLEALLYRGYDQARIVVSESNNAPLPPSSAPIAPSDPIVQQTTPIGPNYGGNNYMPQQQAPIGSAQNPIQIGPNMGQQGSNTYDNSTYAGVDPNIGMYQDAPSYPPAPGNVIVAPPAGGFTNEVIVAPPAGGYTNEVIVAPPAGGFTNEVIVAPPSGGYTYEEPNISDGYYPPPNDPITQHSGPLSPEPPYSTQYDNYQDPYGIQHAPQPNIGVQQGSPSFNEPRKPDYYLDGQAIYEDKATIGGGAYTEGTINAPNYGGDVYISEPYYQDQGPGPMTGNGGIVQDDWLQVEGSRGLPPSTEPDYGTAPTYSDPYTQPAPTYSDPYTQPAPTYSDPYTQPAPTYTDSYTQPAPTYSDPYTQPASGSTYTQGGTVTDPNMLPYGISTETYTDPMSNSQPIIREHVPQWGNDVYLNDDGTIQQQGGSTQPYYNEYDSAIQYQEQQGIDPYSQNYNHVDEGVIISNPKGGDLYDNQFEDDFNDYNMNGVKNKEYYRSINKKRKKLAKKNKRNKRKFGF